MTSSSAATAPFTLPDLASVAQETRRSYEGCDPNLQENPSCWTCGEKPGTLLCSRCKILPYCSSDCQKADFRRHKASCQKLDRLVRQMEREAESLRAGQFGFGLGPPENAFEQHAGSFWGLIETRDYMRARLAVAKATEQMNWPVESQRGWDMVAAHLQDMLRLCASDNLGLRYRFPFVLLNLNRDDDAHCFVRYWMEDYDSYCEDAREENHARSKEGDWLYPREEGARYGDILERCPDEKYNYEYKSLALLVASAVIKMRVVAALDAKRLREDADFDPEQLEKQRKMLGKLLDVIDRNNKTMLPALLHPEPLRRGPRPGFHSAGHPSEARMVLEDACRPWARIPGSLEILEARFGTATPVYDTDMQL